MNRPEYPPTELHRKIAALPLKVFATDVDGTLTDGGMYYTEAGEAMKRFDTRDAAAMSRLRQRGFTLMLVTTENSPIVRARARKLQIEHVYTGVEDKAELVQSVLDKLGASWDSLAYVGDEMNDLPVICRAGFSACPADAVEDVRAECDYVCANPGGHGAVREVCDLIRAALGRSS